MKRYIILITLMLLFVQVFADMHPASGEYGFKFLNIPTSPVSTALASRGIHSEHNSFGWLLQPAAIGSSSSVKSFNFTHQFWLGESAYNSFGYVSANRKAHTALAVRNLNYGKIESRDESGQLIGHYEPVDMAVTANHSRRLGTGLYLGANLSVAYEKLDTASALALSTDLGISYLPMIKDSKLSFAVRNLGFSGKMENESISMPLSFDLDFSKGFEIKEQYLALEAAMVKPVDDYILYNLAAELELIDIFILRGGYRINGDWKGPTAGIGLNISNFEIDYGFARNGKGAGDVHNIGIGYHF